MPARLSRPTSSPSSFAFTSTITTSGSRQPRPLSPTLRVGYHAVGGPEQRHPQRREQPSHLLAFNGSAATAQDLESAYTPAGVTRASRGFLFLNNGTTFVVVDSFTLPSPATNITNISSSVHVNGTVLVQPGAQAETVSVPGAVGPAAIAILPPSFGTNCTGLALVATVVAVPPIQYPTAGIVSVDAVTTSVGAGCGCIAISIGDPIASLPDGSAPFRISPDVSTWATDGPIVGGLQRLDGMMVE